jgi:hypothetical protein
MLGLSQRLPNLCRPRARATGTKRALKPVQVWGIRIRLQVQQRLRDLALFDLLWTASFGAVTWLP